MWDTQLWSQPVTVSYKAILRWNITQVKCLVQMLRPQGCWLSHGAPRTPHRSYLENYPSPRPTPSQSRCARNDRTNCRDKAYYCASYFPTLSFFSEMKTTTSLCITAWLFTDDRCNVIPRQRSRAHAGVLRRCVRTGKLSHQMSSTFKLRGFKLIISHAAVFFLFLFLKSM